MPNKTFEERVESLKINGWLSGTGALFFSVDGSEIAAVAPDGRYYRGRIDTDNVCVSINLADLDQICILLTKEVGQFLMDHGGMANGYQTWAEGSLSGHMHGNFTIELNNDDLTRKQIRVLGAELCGRLFNLIPKYVPQTIVFKVTPYHVDHGCFETSVSAVIKSNAVVNLYGRPRSVIPI